MLLLTEKDVNSIVERIDNISGIIEDALKKHGHGKTIVPDKISQIFDQSTQNRINCMPATMLDEKICGFKWVSVFPTNHLLGVRNVHGYTGISEIDTGRMICLCSSSLLTSLRTAVVGSIAAQYLAIRPCKRVAIIGAGEEARHHLIQLRRIFPELESCGIASRTSKSENRFVKDMCKLFPDMEFNENNGDFERVCEGADIVITATSSQEQVLKARSICNGMLYIHVGGLEDEFDIPLKADKIVCDEWNAVKHRTQTISQLYKSNRLRDDQIYADLWEIIDGIKKGRETADEFIYFNSVGLAPVDVYLAYAVYKCAVENKMGIEIDMDSV